MNSVVDKFHSMVRRVLSEELENPKVSAVGTTSPARVPEMDANGVDPKKKNKRFSTDANTIDVQSKEGLLDDLCKTVAAIDKTISVEWDDHDDLMINARDLKFIRISPRWTDYYVIEMMTRNEDRIWVTGQSWEQVKEFVKTNLKALNKQPTSVEKGYDKSYRSREDKTPSPDKGLNQKDKPKTLPLTSEPVNTTKNKDKNYTETPKDNDDLPDKPMKEVGKFKWQSDHKVQDPVKLRKKHSSDKLVIKLK